MISTIAVIIVALLHAYFLVLEMFLWDKPAGKRAFGHTREQAKATKALAGNQGLYNGFIAVGLIYGLVRDGSQGMEFQIFFLICVVIAGIYGAITASKKILYVQAIPGLIALALVLL